MIVGKRILLRLSSLGLNQSELARRVGMSQGAMNNLIAGRSRSSTHLHKIARELRTTPAFLSAETDDPDSEAPTPPEFGTAERDLIGHFRDMSARTQASIAAISEELSEHARFRAGLQVFLSDEDAIAQMLERLLGTLDLAAPTPVVARKLAKRLPSGLTAAANMTLQAQP